MIITKTPLRISFTGGGSDLPQYLEKNNGAVISTAINKYIYVCLNKKYDDKILLSYSHKENVKNIKSIKHKIFRETLKYFNINKSIELASIADVPSKGSGLGSSSAFTNGLILALSNYKKIKMSKYNLANLSSMIEINKCNQTIGFQDQYATSFGGFNLIEFKKNKISVKKLKVNKNIVNKLEKNLILFDTKIGRSSSDVLKSQIKNINNNFNTKNYVSKMVELSYLLYSELSSNNISNFGEILDENWKLKKLLSNNVSNNLIDHYYNTAKKNGAIGGKLLGAGKGGFLMLYANQENHNKIIKSLKKLNYFRVKFENKGSEVIFNNDNQNK